MKYKVGDIVKIKDDLSVEKYEEQSEQGIVEDMIEYRGEEAKVIEIDLVNKSYSLDIDNGKWAWEEFILENVEYKSTVNKEYEEEKKVIEAFEDDLKRCKNKLILCKQGLLDLRKVLTLIKKLQQENSELKNRLAWRVKYSQKLEEDLYGSMNKYIEKDNVKESINKIEKILKDLKEKMYNENDNL